MITNKNLITNKSWDKISIRKKQQQKIDNNCQQDLKDRNNRAKDNNNIYQTIWLDIPYYIKYKFSPSYKAVNNYAMSYLTILIIADTEVLEDLEN